MSKLANNIFKGMLPKMDSKLLPNGYSTDAVNVVTDSGALVPLKAPLLDTSLSTNAARTVHKLGSVWLYWNADINVVPSIVGSVQEEVVVGTLDTDGSTTSAISSGFDFARQGVADGMLFINMTNNESGVISAISGGTLTIAATATSNDKGDEFKIVYTSGIDDRYYYTGDGRPRASNATLTGTSSPVNGPTSKYYLGLPRPLTSVTLSPNGSGDNFATTNYVYTYVSEWGEESLPSPTSADVTVVGTDWSNGAQVSNFAIPGDTTNYNIVYVNLYRLVAGSNTSEYLLVEQIPVSDISSQAWEYADTVESDDLGRICESWDYRQPPTTLSGLIQFNSRVLAGFVGNELFLSEPNKPHAWPNDYVITLKENIVGLAMHDTTLVVCTEGRPYLVIGEDPINLSVIPLPYDQPCLSKRGIVSTDFGVMYPCPDGMLLVVSGSKEEIITKNIWSRDQWNALGTLSNLLSIFHDGVLYLLFEGTTTGYFIDLREEQFDAKKIDLSYSTNTPQISSDVVIRGGYSDGNEFYLIGSASTTYTIYKFGGSSNNLVITWMSKDYQEFSLKNYSAARVISDSANTFVYKVDGTAVTWGDATQTKAISAGSSGIFRIPNKRGRVFNFGVTSGTANLDFMGVAQSVAELKI